MTNRDSHRTEHRRRRLIGLAALLVGLSILGFISMNSIGDDLVYYWSPTEVRAKAAEARDATIRLGGMVEPGSVDWNPGAQTLAFRVTDGAETIAVEGKGAPPQMFREGIGVVVEGKLDGDGVFRSSTVMVKHSNEYQPPEDGERPEEIYKRLRQEGT
jgi:cytochrome c-type biogenesis protein CcmE